MERRVFFEVGPGQLEQRRSRPRPVLLQMHKGAGQLDETLVKGAVGTVFVLEPDVFEDFVGLVKSLAVEQLEIAAVMRIQLPAGELPGHGGDAFVLAAHERKVRSKVQTQKPKVTIAIRTSDIGLVTVDMI